MTWLIVVVIGCVALLILWFAWRWTRPASYLAADLLSEAEGQQRSTADPEPNEKEALRKPEVVAILVVGFLVGLFASEIDRIWLSWLVGAALVFSAISIIALIRRARRHRPAASA